MERRDRSGIEQFVSIINDCLCEQDFGRRYNDGEGCDCLMLAAAKNVCVP